MKPDFSVYNILVSSLIEFGKCDAQIRRRTEKAKTTLQMPSRVLTKSIISLDAINRAEML